MRQIAHRARAHVAARRPAGRRPRVRDPGVLRAFQRAVETGDLQGLLDLLSPGVVLLADGGGVVQAARVPVVGATTVARFLSKIPSTISVEHVEVNGHPALAVHLDGELDTVIGVRLDDGLISELYAVRNPAKLSRMHQETTLRR